MKKITFLVAIMCWTFICHAQVNIVNIPQESNNEIVEMVNGVPISDDIGGVDIEYEAGVPFVRRFRDYYYGDYHEDKFDNLFVKLTNYNDFAVTVYYEIRYKGIIPRELEGREDFTEIFVKAFNEKGKIVLPPASQDRYPVRYIKPTGETIMINIDEFKTVTKSLSKK